MTDERREQARELFHAAYVAQMQGRFEQAVELYKGSIAAYPSRALQSGSESDPRAMR